MVIKNYFNLLFCMSMIFFATGAAFSKPFQTKKDNLEDKIIASIHNLPEVKEFFISSKNSQPEIMMAGEPDANWKYYSVKVGLGNLGIFRTMYDFCVDPVSFKVYYLDMMVDDGESAMTEITLKQWRYWRTKPGFNKMHYYRNNKLIMVHYKKNRISY